MKIAELMNELAVLKTKYGDLDVLTTCCTGGYNKLELSSEKTKSNVFGFIYDDHYQEIDESLSINAVDSITSTIKGFVIDCSFNQKK